MRLLIAALALSLTVAVVAAVFAIWPAVAGAPWEDGAEPAPTRNPIIAIRCAAALELRNAVEVAMWAPGQERFNRDGLEDALSKAEREMERWC